MGVIYDLSRRKYNMAAKEDEAGTKATAKPKDRESDKQRTDTERIEKTYINRPL